MRTFMLFVIAISLLLVIGCSNSGTGPDVSAQTKVAEDGYTYLKTLNWPEYAKLMHPEALNDFRLALMPGIEKLVSASQTDSIAIFNKSYASVEIQSMPEDSFFVAMMLLMESLTPEFAATYKNIEATTLGAVAEGDTLTHVVSRTTMSFGLRSVNEMEVQSVRLVDGEWKLEPSNKITGIVMILQQGMPR